MQNLRVAVALTALTALIALGGCGGQELDESQRAPEETADTSAALDVGQNCTFPNCSCTTTTQCLAGSAPTCTGVSYRKTTNSCSGTTYTCFNSTNCCTLSSCYSGGSYPCARYRVRSCPNGTRTIVCGC